MTAATPHIFLDDHGRAWVDESNVKVIEIVLDHLAYGWNADTIQEHHPGLSLAQVYAALAWYYDHQLEMEAEIVRQGKRLEEWRSNIAPSALQRRALAARR